MADRKKLPPKEAAAAQALATLIAERTTIPKLAERVGVTPAAVGHWARGEIPVPLRRAAAVADALALDDPGRICQDWEENVAPFIGGSKLARASQPVGLDVGKLATVLAVVEGAVKDSGKEVPAAFKARMIQRVYESQHALSADSASAVQAALAGLLETLGTE